MDEFYRLIGKLYVEKEALHSRALFGIDEEKKGREKAETERDELRDKLTAAEKERDDLLKLMTKAPADDRSP